jgi:murein DD-endopeptidase MepM/ murein hydrolase activator NlpD
MKMKILAKLFLIIFVFSLPLGMMAEDANDEIKALNKDIQAKQSEIEAIQEKQEVYSKIIAQKQGERASLSNQLAILENRLAKAELDIENTNIEIDRVGLEIKKVDLEIQDKDKKINQQKEHLTSVLQLIQRQDSSSLLEVLLLNNSLADFVNQVKYLEDINDEIGESLDALNQYKAQLKEQKDILVEKNRNLVSLKSQLEEQQDALSGERENKNYVIAQTKSSEAEYQRLLAAAKLEQEQAAAEIVSLEKAVRSKLSGISGDTLEFNDNGLIWPVPRNVITATFHDPDYPFRYIFEHPGVDIRAGQGTTLRAAASGYVARAKDAGMGYSYIMIVHGDGLATVYGHVSKIYVSEDEYVVQGQAIGASGGMPGTPGAGNLTTGPHLHFEVRLDGIPVNPLEYLP